MVQYLNNALVVVCLVSILQRSSATNLLRSSSAQEQPTTLQDVLNKLRELESKTIPSLLENIATLEEKVSELEEHRRLANSCDFARSADGNTCQMEAPVIFLSDVTMHGNNSETKILGDLTVEGNTVLNGGSTRIFSSKVNMTGTATIADLTIGNSLEVVGSSIFDSNIEVVQDTILDHGLTTKGHAHFFDLDLDDELDVKGKTLFEKSVSIIGKDHELHVDGDVTIDHTLTVDGETTLQDVTEEGQLVFNNKVVFNNDVQMDNLQVQDLTVDGSCAGCV